MIVGGNPHAGPAFAKDVVPVTQKYRMRFLKEGTFPERKALIRNFVEGIKVVGDEPTLTYAVPMPSDGGTLEPASVLNLCQVRPS